MPAAFDAETLSQRFAQLSERFERIEAQLEILSEKLGVPYARPGAGVPPEVMAAVRAGNQVEAIKQYRLHTGAGLAEAQQAIAEL